jgi:hypothetical protein
MAAKDVISLREKKVVLSACPEREFYFLSKNKVGCTEGKTQHIYQRQRRGVHITWLDLLAEFMEPRVVTDDGSGLDAQLELAYRLMEDEKNRVAMEKFVARTKKRPRQTT